MRPTPLLARKYLSRAATTWMLARLLASAVLFLGGMDVLRLSATQVALIIAAAVALGIVDVIRRHERALLENLAVSRGMLFALLGAPAFVGELGIVILVRLGDNGLRALSPQ